MPEYLYLALTEDDQDMGVFTTVQDCIKYLVALGLSPSDYLILPLNPEIPIKHLYKIFEGYVNYFRGDITLQEFNITAGNISYANPVNVFYPAPNTEYENNIPITWYCKIMVRADIASNLQSFSLFVTNTAKAEIESKIKEMLKGGE